jgi:alpha-galactosidase
LKVKTVEEMKLDREAANKNAGEADKGKDRAAVSS